VTAWLQVNKLAQSTLHFPYMINPSGIILLNLKVNNYPDKEQTQQEPFSR